MKTDIEFWEQVRNLLPSFMSLTYESCEGWKCGVAAKYCLARFKKYVEKEHGQGDISFLTYYNELRRLGFELPVSGKSYDSNTRIRGIKYRG